MPQPWQRDDEGAHLHQAFLEKVNGFRAHLSGEDLPFRLFEGFRSPQRQRYLYEQGRSRPGQVVTKARPWESYHQYGLAIDMVFYEDGKWSWDDSGSKRKWCRLHEMGRSLGIEPISWETPHLQFADLSLSDLQAGRYPPAGREAWEEWMEGVIGSLSESPPAPPVPAGAPQRPPLAPGFPGVDAARILPGGSTDWHNYDEGREWKYDGEGVYIRDCSGGREPWRTPGEPATCRAIWSLFREDLLDASRRFNVPTSLLMMIVATETAFARAQGFSGPLTFRWEPHVLVEDVSPPIWGDYSAGPMQILASTARWLIRQQRLDFDPFKVAPVFDFRPEAPSTLGTGMHAPYWRRRGSDEGN